MLPALDLLLLLLFLATFWRLREMQKTVALLNDRLGLLEKRGPSSAPVAPPNEPRIEPRPAKVSEPVTIAPRASQPPPIPQAAAPPAHPAIDWEQFMGVKLFAWLGGLALFFGVVFLVKYSFENNLITPLGRIVIGGAVGVILVAAGSWLAHGRYGVTGQSLCATGVVILYANIFAAHSFYALISLTSAFFAMSAVTLGAFLLAVNLSAQVIVILGLLGGFLTPVLLPVSADDARPLFIYIALLDLGVVAVALRQRWTYLVLLAAVGTVLTQLGWAAQFFNATKGAAVWWIFLGFEALFLATFFFRNRASPNRWTTSGAALVGLAALGFGFWILATPALALQPFYFFGFVFLADAGLLALVVLGGAHRVIAWAAGAVAFILIGTWIEFFAPHAALSAALAAIVVFAFLHAATTPASAWRPGLLPFTASGTLAPFLLLIALIDRVSLANPTPIFAVALVLTATLLAVAIVKGADWLALAALLGSGATELAWQSERFSETQAVPALACYGILLALFVAFPFFAAAKEKAPAWAASALAQALGFWLFDRAIVAAFPNEWMGLLAAVFVLPGAVSLFALMKFLHASPASGDARLAWQGGAVLLFVSLIFPLQFEREWITLGWALEGFALLGLFRRVPHRGLRLVAVLLLSAAFVRLALNPAVLEYHKRSATRLWNWYLYAYGLTTACLLGGAAIFGQPRKNLLERAAPPVLYSLGAILAFLLLNVEIADYFSIGPTLTFSFSGNFARDMTYSLAWALFALALIVIGMRLRDKAARYAGLGLLSVTLLKLFLHDLQDLGELYRIGAFIGVAVILIVASLVYQRFLTGERRPPSRPGLSS